MCKMWYYFFAFCHVFVFFVFLKLVLDVLSFNCFRFLLCLEIYLGPPGTLVHTKIMC